MIVDCSAVITTRFNEPDADVLCQLVVGAVRPAADFAADTTMPLPQRT